MEEGSRILFELVEPHSQAIVRSGVVSLFPILYLLARSRESECSALVLLRVLGTQYRICR